MPEIASYCRARNIAFSYVDLRWGLTTDEARLNTIGTCLSEVLACNYFVGIIGSRYGWSSGSEYTSSFERARLLLPWLDNLLGKSATELEILQACAKSSSGAKSTFFYESMTQPQQQQQQGDEESPEAIAKLQQLKSQLQLNHKPFKFTDPSVLSSTLVKDIKNKIDLEFGEMVGRPHEIELQIGYAQSLLTNYVDFNEEVIKRLNDHLADRRDGKPLTVSGSSGCGKSTLIAHWISKLRQHVDPTKTLLVALFAGASPRIRSADDVLRATCSAIQETYAPSSPPLPESPTALLEELRHWLDVATRDGRTLVWMIDGLDDTTWIPARLPVAVRLVLTGPSPTDKPSLTTLLPFTQHQRRLFIERYLASYGKRLEESHMSAIVACDACGSPRFLQAVLFELLAIGNYANYANSITSLLECPDVPSLYSRIFARWESDKAYPTGMVADILQLLEIARTGLSESEILRMLNLTTSQGFFSASRPLLSRDAVSAMMSLPSSDLVNSIAKRYANNNVANQRKRLLGLLIQHFTSLPASARKVDALPRLLKANNDKPSLLAFLKNIEHFKLLTGDSGRIALLGHLKYLELTDSSAAYIFRDIYDDYATSHPPLEELARTTQEFGAFFEILSFYDDAYRIIENALDLHINLYGELHPNVVQDLQLLVSISIHQSKLETSDYLSKKTLGIASSVFGSDKFGTCEPLMLSGLVMKKKGNYESALGYYKSALDIMLRTFGYDASNSGEKDDGQFYNSKLADLYTHLEVAEILNSVGLVYKKQSKYLQAEKEYKRAILIVNKSLGQDHPKLGIYTKKTGKFDLAKSLYTKALGIIEKSLGTEHSEYAEVLYGIGLLNLSLEDFNNSIVMIEKAIYVASRELGDDHPKIVFNIELLRDTYERSHRILSNDLGENHPELIDIWSNRAELEFGWGSHQLAKEYFEKALAIIKEVFDEEHEQ
eukprot:gene15528-18446_t